MAESGTPKFTVITKNAANTVGILTNVEDLLDVGDFKISDLKEWFEKIELMFGDEDVNIKFKLSNDPRTPAYGIFACAPGDEDPHVAVCGKYRADLKLWGSEE